MAKYDNINKSLTSYAKLMNYKELISSEEDKLDTIIITAKISDMFNNNSVDYIITPTKVKSNNIILNDDKFRYIKNLTTETLSCNRYSIKFLCDGIRKPEFHLSSLSRFDDNEIHIFTIFKNEKYVILFDKIYLDTKHNLQFDITDAIITKTGIELQFDFMNWGYNTSDLEYRSKS